MKINRNMSAVITNRQLLRTENRLAVSMERLSSGYKINNAGDNPAGIAISSKMRAQIAGLDQAETNASDGESVLNIADGALNEVSNILQRIRELAVQAANDTNTYSDRQAMQDEIDELTKEVDRISTDTEYNSKTLLDGSCSRRIYSTGVERLDVSSAVLPAEYTLGVSKAAAKAECEIAAPTAGSADGTIEINGVKMDYEQGMSDEEFFQELRNTAEQAGCEVEQTANGYKISSKYYGSDETISMQISDSLGAELLLNADSVKLSVEAESLYAKDPDSSEWAEITFTAANTASAGTIKINDTEVEYDPTGTLSFEDTLKAAAQQAGCSVTVSATTTGEYTLTSSSDISLVFSGDLAKDITVSNDDGKNEVNYVRDSKGKDAVLKWDEVYDTTVAAADQVSWKKQGGFSSTATYTADGNRITITDKSGFSMDFMLKDETNVDEGANGPDEIKIEVTDIGSMTLQVGSNQYQEIDVDIPAISSESMYLDTVDVTVAGGADKALVTIDDAISKLGDVRSAIGAYTNRLEYAQKSLAETQEDLTTAFSNLMDTDMAEEMTYYTEQNVLEQATISVLSQANDIPQQVLSLLS